MPRLESSQVCHPPRRRPAEQITADLDCQQHTFLRWPTLCGLLRTLRLRMVTTAPHPPPPPSDPRPVCGADGSLPQKVLDETFALEESKRLELEQLEHEKREEEKRLQREHEATKVKLSRNKTAQSMFCTNVLRTPPVAGWLTPRGFRSPYAGSGSTGRGGRDLSGNSRVLTISL